ncbi:transcription factor 12-like [Myxocyprinus asiaticus]|uniref:transcription factor 12-like n=1 Tax=Myxocyprinus asiaticus TaxID=70543 RepID=UPI0022233802|nr:transcription factor 12-like [Myxocyprinus asiaticus]
MFVWKRETGVFSKRAERTIVCLIPLAHITQQPLRQHGCDPWSSANRSSPSGQEVMLGNLLPSQPQPGNYGNLTSHERLNVRQHSTAASEVPKHLPSMLSFHRDSYLSVRSAESCTGASQTGDASINSSDHSSDSSVCSSSPLTPPTGANQWPQSTGQTSLPANYNPPLHSLIEDRLDRLEDAIHVLRNHAVGVTNADLTNDLCSLFGPITSMRPNLPTSGLMTNRTSVASESAGVAMFSSVAQLTSDTTNQRGRHRGVMSQDVLRCVEFKSERVDVEELRQNSSDEDIRDAGTRASVHEDENLSPEQKAGRERERRMANNARERLRVHDINEAFKELGHMCHLHLQNDKPQTKLLILNQAVTVILSLEQQVRERNLNPKTACQHRREDEKSYMSLDPQFMNIHNIQTDLHNNMTGRL